MLKKVAFEVGKTIVILAAVNVMVTGAMSIAESTIKFIKDKRESYKLKKELGNQIKSTPDDIDDFKLWMAIAESDFDVTLENDIPVIKFDIKLD